MSSAFAKDVEALVHLSSDDLRKAIEQLVKDHGINTVNTWQDASRHKNGLIHRLTILGHIVGVEALADARADLNCRRESDDCTALHLAIWHGQPVLASRLLELGAKDDIVNAHGETAKELEALSARNYLCWHQQADLLLNVAPMVLRQVLRERWVAYAGPNAEIGPTIIAGSADKIVVGGSVSVRHGSNVLYVQDDIRSVVGKGQSVWLNGTKLEVVDDPAWKGSSSQFRSASWVVTVKDGWNGNKLTNGVLEVQKVPAELRLPPGSDAEKKIKKGKLEAWDITLLAHFLGDDQCRLACNIVPDQAQRRIVRELKDVRNKAALHLGRAEIDPKVVDGTADLIMRLCNALAPSMATDVQRMIDEVRNRRVVAENVIRDMESQIHEERTRAAQMEGQLAMAARFSSHVPPTALSSDAGSTSCGDTASEWSAKFTQRTMAAPCRETVLGSLAEMAGRLELPEHCSREVVEQSLRLIHECPNCSNKLLNVHMSANLMLVIRTSASLDSVMLNKVSHPDVQERWKLRQADVHQLQPTFDLLQDWSLPDGVLVSGEKGRVLRVSAQFRPPAGPWSLRAAILRKAMDVACAAEVVVIVNSEGRLYAFSSVQALHGVYFKLAVEEELKGQHDEDSEEPSIEDGSDADEAMSVFRGAETATDCGAGGGGFSTLKKMGDMYWPFMEDREQMTEFLHRQASENILRWGTDEGVPLPDDEAALVAENSAKWLWKVFEKSSKEEAEKALKLCEAVCHRLEAGGNASHVPQLLLPMGEVERVLGNTAASLEHIKRARRLSMDHNDFEASFSAHQSLFAFFMRDSRHVEARAVLESSQRMLDKERDTRDGPGMEEFMQAKQLFQSSNMARLDSKLALASQEPAALQKAKEMLQGVVEGMTAMRGSSFRGNTGKNLAELLSLLCYVAMACYDAPAARKALEQELVLRRQMQQPSKVAMVNIHLGRALLGLEPPDLDAAEEHLTEAQEYLKQQQVEGQGGDSTDGIVTASMQDVLRLRAKAAEFRGDAGVAVSLLLEALSMAGSAGGNGAASGPSRETLLQDLMRLQAPETQSQQVEKGDGSSKKTRARGKAAARSDKAVKVQFEEPPPAVATGSDRKAEGEGGSREPELLLPKEELPLEPPSDAAISPPGQQARGKKGKAKPKRRR